MLVDLGVGLLASYIFTVCCEGLILGSFPAENFISVIKEVLPVNAQNTVLSTLLGT